MEGRRPKRGKAKATGSHGRVTEKKKKTQVINAKEELDRLEAASVLSSLRFFPPKSSDLSEANSPVRCEPNGVVGTASTVTYISTAPTNGNPMRVPPQGPQSIAGGSGISKMSTGSAFSSVKPPVNMQANNIILARLQNHINYIMKNGQSHPQIQLAMPTQVQALQRVKQTASVKGTAVPNTVKHAESPKLPVTINMGQTVNRDVASALRQAVTSTNRKQIVVNNAALVKTKANSSAGTQAKAQKEKDTPLSDILPLPLNSGTLLSSSVVESDSTSHLMKKDNSDNKLPLKKRRLVPVGEASPHDIADLDSKVDQNEMIQSISSTRLSDLTSAVQIENILQLAREYPAIREQNTAASVISLTSNTIAQDQAEGYRPVDPRTSLMVLSDVKVALTPDADGDLPIHIAVVHENTELVKKFIDIMAMSGKSLDRYNKLQQTPLHLAILVNKCDIVAALLLAGANPNLVDRHGCTALHIAVTKQFPGCLHTVFEQTGVELRLNTRNYEGYPPLHTCVDLDDLETLKYLVHHGALVDIQDGKAGRSALFYATEYNRVKMVDLLISENANADMQNYAGVTPLMVAQSANMTEMIQVLQKALDILKLPDDSQDQIKKVQIPRIPSKSSLIVPDTSLRSRSNSEDGPSPALRVQTPSVSSCSSPIDLSFSRNTESPKDLSRERKDRTSFTSIVKEKHTQLVAALEGRNVIHVERNQVMHSSVDTSKTSPDPVGSLPQPDIYISGKITGESLLKRLKRDDDSLQVTSSSDMSVDISQESHLCGEDSRTESDMVTEVSENKDISSDRARIEHMETVCHTDVFLEKNTDTQTVSVSTVTGKKGTALDKLEPLDTDIPNNNSPYTETSPEMPVLSRIASFSNEQELCSASVAEDVPEIDKEDMSHVNVENGSEVKTKSQVVYESQKSQESLGSSQGFETEAMANRKSVEGEMEMEVSLENMQKSDNSDDSVEIDNRALSKVSIIIADKEDIVKGHQDIERKQITDDVGPSTVDTDEEDEDKPLVIDETPMETNAEVNPEVRNRSKPSENNTRSCLGSTSSRTEREFPVSEQLESDNRREQSAIDNANKFKGITGKRVPLFKPREKDSSEPNELSKNAASNMVTSLNAITLGRNQPKISQNSSEAILNSLKVKAHISNNNMSETSGESCIENSGEKSTHSEKILGESGVEDSLESSESTGLGSVDNLLTDGKAHTLFYRDGDGYKPIRIFIDNSEQSSLVLQKMLKASFANSLSNQAAQSNPASSTSDCKAALETVASETDPNLSQKRSQGIQNRAIVDLEKKTHSKITFTNGQIDRDSMMLLSDKESANVSSSNNIDKNKTDTHAKNCPSSSQVMHANTSEKTPVGPGSLVMQATDLKSQGLAKSSSMPSFQKAYIESLKVTSQSDLAVLNSSRRVKAGKVQSVSDKTVSSSSEAKLDSLASKHQKVSSTKVIKDKLTFADQASNNMTEMSVREVKSVSSVKEAKTKSGDTKIVELNAAEKIIKLHISPDMMKPIKTTVPFSSDTATVTLPTSSVTYSSALSQLSGQNTRKYLTPRLTGTQSTTFQPGRMSVSEGTLTRINPNIKSKLSMALQSSQRKLVKARSEHSQETEGKYQNVQEFVSSSSVGSCDGVTEKTVTDSRQQL